MIEVEQDATKNNFQRKTELLEIKYTTAEIKSSVWELDDLVKEIYKN